MRFLSDRHACGRTPFSGVFEVREVDAADAESDRLIHLHLVRHRGLAYMSHHTDTKIADTVRLGRCGVMDWSLAEDSGLSRMTVWTSG